MTLGLSLLSPCPLSVLANSRGERAQVVKTRFLQGRAGKLQSAEPLPGSKE